MSAYTEQADKFLTDTGSTFEIIYSHTGPYFDDDNEERDVYTFTLRNARGEYSGKFGDSLQNTKSGKRTSPTAYDVLACLQKYDVGTFANFCAEFGYDERPLSEYPNVMRTYDAVCKEYAALRRMYTPAELDQLCEVQ